MLRSGKKSEKNLSLTKTKHVGSNNRNKKSWMHLWLLNRPAVVQRNDIDVVDQPCVETRKKITKVSVCLSGLRIQIDLKTNCCSFCCQFQVEKNTNWSCFRKTTMQDTGLWWSSSVWWSLDDLTAKKSVWCRCLLKTLFRSVGRERNLFRCTEQRKMLNLSRWYNVGCVHYAVLYYFLCNALLRTYERPVLRKLGVKGYHLDHFSMFDKKAFFGNDKRTSLYGAVYRYLLYKCILWMQRTKRSQVREKAYNSFNNNMLLTDLNWKGST